jgi:NTE family protein
LRGRRYIRMLETLFGDLSIEDALLPYFCVSTNLTRGDSVVHSTGRFRKWVAASIAVPGLGPPVFRGREILVDGGVLNALPVDVMRSFGRGSVLASNVSPPEKLWLDREYRDFPSPWRVLLSRLNPFGRPIRVPSITGILMSAASLPRVGHGVGEQTADLVFEPPVAGHKLLDWHCLDQLVEIGYRSAVQTIARWAGPFAAR